MSIARLRARVPSATRIGTCTLPGHELRFHKAGRDGSGKCDAFKTGETGHRVLGALFEISPGEKSALDEAEGLGGGYAQKQVALIDQFGAESEAYTYYATSIDSSLGPYAWYLMHVLTGARECSLPQSYISAIEAHVSIDDPDRHRDATERAIYTVLPPAAPRSAKSASGGKASRLDCAYSPRIGHKP